MTAPAVLRGWTIYQGASDVAAPFCARPWAVDAGGVQLVGPAVAAWSLGEARALVPAGLYRIGRADSDDPVIVETWL